MIHLGKGYVQWGRVCGQHSETIRHAAVEGGVEDAKGHRALCHCNVPWSGWFVGPLVK